MRKLDKINLQRVHTYELTEAEVRYINSLIVANIANLNIYVKVNEKAREAKLFAIGVQKKLINNMRSKIQQEIEY